MAKCSNWIWTMTKRFLTNLFIICMIILTTWLNLLKSVTDHVYTSCTYFCDILCVATSRSYVQYLYCVMTPKLFTQINPYKDLGIAISFTFNNLYYLAWFILFLAFYLEPSILNLLFRTWICWMCISMVFRLDGYQPGKKQNVTKRQPTILNVSLL